MKLSDPKWIEQKYRINAAVIRLKKSGKWDKLNEDTKLDRTVHPMEIFKVFDPVQTISLHYEKDNPPEQIITTVEIGNKPLIACWDTGFADCGISKEAAKKLNLIPLPEKEPLSTGSGIVEANVYFADINFCNGAVAFNVKTREVDIEGVDILIGMSVISKGDFTLKHTENGIDFTFDFV